MFIIEDEVPLELKGLTFFVYEVGFLLCSLSWLEKNFVPFLLLYQL